MLVLMILLALNTVFAADLSDYPSLFVEDGQFNAIIVVGDKASAYDTISQSLIATSLVRKLNRPLSGINKLASEVSDINQNIITIGSPCVNKITAKIMGSPEPCDIGFREGNGYIKLIEADGHIYIIVAGKTDKDTRRAAEALSNHDKYDLEGDEYIAISPVIKDSDIEIPISEDNKPAKEENKTSESDGSEKQKEMDESAKKTETESESGRQITNMAEKECLPIGKRINDKYCSEDGMISQKEDKEQCSNDYECAGNKCTDNKCGYKKEGKWAKFISWIKHLFA